MTISPAASTQCLISFQSMLEIEVALYNNAKAHIRYLKDPKPRAKTESQFAWMMMKSHWWAVTTS